jgi:hypothetical protein
MSDRADAGAARETTHSDPQFTSVSGGAVSRSSHPTEAGYITVTDRMLAFLGRGGQRFLDELEGRQWRLLLLSAPVLAAAAVWTVSLQSVEIRQVGGAGLVSALPLPAFVALAVACGSFAVAVSRARPSQSVLVLHLVLMIYMLYGATALIEQVPSFNVSWRHVGIAKSIVNHGYVTPETNAYFNWPGFFLLAGLATKLAGLGTPLQLVPWAPVVFELLYLAPLIVISRAATSDPRLPWVAAWVFYLTNWVYQDYFSPQALTYFLYLALFAVLLHWFSGRPAAAATRLFGRATKVGSTLLVEARPVGSNARRSPLSPGQRAALVVICFALIAATVPSHQLTPFAMLAGATALVALRLCSVSTLPAIILVLTVTWSVFAAGPYLNGHLGAQVGPGQAGSILSSVTGRVVGSEAHVVVAYLRLATTFGLWTLAAVAALRVLRRRHRQWAGHVVLAAAPFTLMLMSAYGGEVLLRIYLFSLPFVAALTASILLAAAGRSGAGRGAVVLGLAGLVLAAGFLFTRYGNERVNLFTQSEVQAVERLYELAPPGSVLAAPNPDLPWNFKGVRAYRYTTLPRELQRFSRPDASPTGAQLAAQTARALDRRRVPAVYLVITRSTREYDSVVGQATWGSVARLQRGVEQSPSFRTVYATRDAEIFQLERRRERSR